MRNYIIHIISRLNVRVIILLTLFCINLKVQGQIAIIVHKDNPVSELSKDELKAIFLGKQTYFEGVNDQILLSDYKPDSDAFCQAVYGYSSKTMQRHWFQLIFSGTVANPPKKISSVAYLVAFISNNERAIGYVAVKDLPENIEGLKILKINGFYPDQKGYVLSLTNSHNKKIILQVNNK